MNPKMPWGDYEYYDRLVKSVLEQAKIYDKNHLTYSLTADQRDSQWDKQHDANLDTRS